MNPRAWILTRRSAVRLRVVHSAAARSIVFVLLLTGCTANRIQAQEEPRRFWSTHEWMGDVTFLSLNSLLAGITAGVIQEMRDGSFQKGFAKGALGGAVAYGGRRLAVESFDGAGLLGRQIGAVGASMTRNAGDGVPLLSRLQLPLGPISLDVMTGPSPRVRPRVNLFATGWLITALLDNRLKLDGGASMSAGVPVFRAPDYLIRAEGGVAGGATYPGLILIGYDFEPGGDTFAHERVHAAQIDLAQIIWGDPFEEWATRQVFGSHRVLQYVQPGITTPVLYGLFTRVIRVGYHDRPWEIEAEFLEKR